MAIVGQSPLSPLSPLFLPLPSWDGAVLAAEDVSSFFPLSPGPQAVSASALVTSSAAAKTRRVEISVPLVVPPGLDGRALCVSWPKVYRHEHDELAIAGRLP
ncbi:hypothetical protein [Streptomyces morookaense]|uniref:Uncharacterized protein n=1 Tax=Streptomyces morookaense TaxID=1970 RepID=A0A7Y7BB48_STRMO|nr:hypothetical protein [Streptomyces morookaense]NVK82149.1 hypothetical protein [Streptomyces morookaense]